MRVYLDYNATAPLLPIVREAMLEYMMGAGNPSSMHQEGQGARRSVTKARGQIAEFVGAHPDQIIFTSGGTEANNLALKGGSWHHVLMSTVEHDSVFKAWENSTLIPVDENGLLDLEELEHYLRDLQGLRVLVSVIWANNETGVLQPMAEIVALSHKYGAFVHTDAVQMMGRQPISFKDMGCDLMTISPHKFGGPQGIGALVVKESIAITPLIFGGGQEKGRRSGTENVAAIVGFGMAVDSAPDLSQLAGWHRGLEEYILKASGNQAMILGKDVDRLPNTTCVVMPGVENAIQVMRFDLEGVAISAGSACSSGRVKTESRIIKAMTHDVDQSMSAIRISSGWASTQDDFIKVQEIWEKIFKDREGIRNGK